MGEWKNAGGFSNRSKGEKDGLQWLKCCLAGWMGIVDGCAGCPNQWAAVVTQAQVAMAVPVRKQLRPFWS
jgi:hypothetical protein